MPVLICNALSPYCIPDWNGVSAVATACATAAALLIPVWQRYQDRIERQKSLAHSTLMKTLKIYSDIFHLKEHIENCKKIAIESGETRLSWRYLRPLASLPTTVAFSSDELAMLFSLKHDDLFNDLLSIDEIHASIISSVRTYIDKREQVMQMLPGAEMDGLTGTTKLSAEQFAKINPYAVQLDILCLDLSQVIDEQFCRVKDVLLGIKELFNNKSIIKTTIQII